MNSDSFSPSGQPDASLQPEGQRRLEAWRSLLAQCARKPSRKRVHGLRSLTLRLRATLEHEMPGEPADSTAARAFKRWTKAGRKLRKALEPVRNTDVYLARLDSLRGALAETPDGATQLSPRCLREIAKLENRLRRERQTEADEMMAVLEARSKRLNRLSKEMEEALARQTPSRVHSTAHEALEIFTGLASELPNLDSSNLHEYRKRLKQALYLAEISATADPLAGRLATAFRRIHDAAGEWHDWQALALEAGQILPAQSNQDGLMAILEALAEKALQRALVRCRRTATRFLKNAGEIQPYPPRKPVAAEKSGWDSVGSSGLVQSRIVGGSRS
ncbi:MAG: CHAD domain-containing protein [Terracidiphilus sp.]